MSKVTVYDALHDYSRQLESMSTQLASDAHPGHTMYCSKLHAASWADTMAREIRELLETGNKDTLGSEL